MKVDTYIETLHNEGFGIERDIDILHNGVLVSTIEVTDKIAINLFKDRLGYVNGATVYAEVGIEDDLHYTDTLRVIEAVSRLLLDITRADRHRVYEALNMGDSKTSTVTIDKYTITQTVNEGILIYEIV